MQKQLETQQEQYRQYEETARINSQLDSVYKNLTVAIDGAGGRKNLRLKNITAQKRTHAQYAFFFCTKHDGMFDKRSFPINSNAFW